MFVSVVSHILRHEDDEVYWRTTKVLYYPGTDVGEAGANLVLSHRNAAVLLYLCERGSHIL